MIDFIRRLVDRITGKKGESMKIVEQQSDRRNYPRISKEVKIEVTEVSYPLAKDTGEHGISKNIGAGGICFSLSSPFSPGTIVSVKIHLTRWQKYREGFAQTLNPSSAAEPLTAIGEIVWCTPTTNGTGYEIGVKFVDIYEDDYKALTKYLENV
ncbi:MAG TPA: PilZ domain-containing protein [Deltaproteobacteria bacterium]|nr:PilZ domain-containing protein [Deltaproteobacteria bacterium]